MSRFFFKKLKIIMAVKFFFIPNWYLLLFKILKCSWLHLKFENLNLLSNPKNWIFDLIKKIQQVTRKSKLAKLCTVFFPRFPIYYIWFFCSVNMFRSTITSECHFLTGLWKCFMKLMIRHRFRWRQTAATTCSSIPLKSICCY